MKISVEIKRGVIVPFKNNRQCGSAAFEPLHGRFFCNPSLASSCCCCCCFFGFGFSICFNNLHLTVSFEVREGSVFKSIRDSFSRNGLLPNTCDHLRDVNKRTCQEGQQTISSLTSLSLHVFYILCFTKCF